MNTWDLGNNEEHQRLRDRLGSYTLGHLGEADEAMVGAHLDGCAACRADLEEIAPLGAMLDLVDARHFDLPALPPGDLGAAIREQVAGEREQQESDDLALARVRARRRTAWRAGLGAAAAIVVAAIRPTRKNFLMLQFSQAHFFQARHSSPTNWAVF